MKKILSIFVFVFIYTSVFSDGYMRIPIYHYTKQISDIVSATIIEKREIKNIDTCLTREIINYPSKYIYKCKVNESFFGLTEKDSVIYSFFQEPGFVEYDDSCREVMSYWYGVSFTGNESKFVKGDKVILFLQNLTDLNGEFNIIAGNKSDSITEIESVYLDYFKDFRFFETKDLVSGNIEAIGIEKRTKHLVLFSPTDSVFIIVNSKNNLIEKYFIKEKVELESWENYNFRFKKGKILIDNSKKETIKLTSS